MHRLRSSQKRSGIKGRASKIVPRGRGVRGAATAVSGPSHPMRLTARSPEEVLEQFLRRIRIHLTAEMIYLMLAGTTFAHSSEVPRVGLRASRAMVGGAAQGRGRPSDGG